MNTLTEPAEIELYDLDKFGFDTEYKRAASIACQQWGRLHVFPQKPVDVEGSSGNTDIIVEPEELSVLERKLFEANADDFQWAQSKIKDLPEYLTRYFVTRYISMLEKQGRNEANTYLRVKMAPAAERAKKVLAQYKSLPTTQKVALLSKEFGEGEEDAFHPVFFTESGNPEDYPRKQLTFDFDQAEKNRKPVKSRLLAELERDELKEMSYQLAKILKSYIAISAAKIREVHQPESEPDIDACMVMTYEVAARFVSQTFGIKPPRKYVKQSGLSAAQDLLRLEDDNWWFGRLVRTRKIMREHLAIAMGQVSNSASPYASWDCIREHKAQQKRNWDAIQNMLLRDEDTEEEFALADMVIKSQANPAIRRHELMVRCRGCEDIGNELGLQGLFLTLTTPSKYHNTYKKGGFIDHWNGSSPRDAQQYLNNVWGLMRTKLSNEGLRWFGVRVAEPHHDGTPHWHLLIWVKPEDVAQVRDIFISYATQEDREELSPSFDRNPKRAEKKKAIQGPLNYKPRCDFGYIDPEKGTATGYIAKYISKNIDGYAMDDLVSDETGKSVKDMAKNVSAWKSRWNIRQFQFFGGAPVTTYRELRRFANNDKASFMDYLTQLTYQQLYNIYEELEVKAGRKLVGPPIPAELIKASKKFDSKYLFNLLGELYQPSMENDNNTAIEVMKAADKGNWHGYIMGQGGPFVKRKDLLITNVYEKLEFASPHGDVVSKLKGFDASGVQIKTRLKNFTITTKAKPEVKKQVDYEFEKPSANPSTWTFKKRTVSFVEVTKPDASTQGSEATAIGSSAASRSSVNNCTQPQSGEATGRTLSPMLEHEIARLIDEYGLSDGFRSDLFKGHWIKLSKEKSVKLRLAATERQPDHLIYQNKPEVDTSWLIEPDQNQQTETKPRSPSDIDMFDTNYDDNEFDYQQPDLALFGTTERQNKPWAKYMDELDHDDWPLA